MTLHDFIALEIYQKEDAVCKSKYLLSRDEGHCRISVFKFNDFFVETYYNKKNKLIIAFRPFKTNEVFKPYFEVLKN